VTSAILGVVDNVSGPDRL